MTNGSCFGFGSVGTVAENFEIVILFLAPVIYLFLTFLFHGLIVEFIILPFRGLIVVSYWDCIIFGWSIRFWFRKRRRKPPDKLCNSNSSRSRDPRSVWFRLW